MKPLYLFCLIILGWLSSTCAVASISLDGKINEQEWNDANVYHGFQVIEPRTFDIPDEQTKVRFVSSPEGLYIGFINHQQDLEKNAKTTLDDQDLLTDYCEVIIDFDGNGKSAYGFRVGRNSTSQDMVWQYPALSNTDWDGDWDYAVSSSDNSWSVEIFIPWSIALVSKQSDQVSGSKTIKAFFARWNNAAQQKYAIDGIDQSRVGFLNQLKPISVAQPLSSSINVFPYISSSFENVSDQSDTKIGLDAFWKINSYQQLNITINPDFGQVENDELVINFSAIETFFSEKRSFFRENQDLFDLKGPESLRLMHTPRIGGGSDSASPIDYATRYTHKGENIDVGLFHAAEGDTKGAPGKDFSAARIQYSDAEFKLGFMYTLVDRSAIDRVAKVSTIDSQWEVTEVWQLSSQLIHTDIQQQGIETKSNSFWITSENQFSDNAAQAITFLNYADNMDVSDFGFVERVDRKQLEYEFVYDWPDVTQIDFIRNLQLTLETEHRRNHQGEKLPSQFAIKMESTAANFWRFEIEHEYRTTGIDDLLTRGNNSFQLPSAHETVLVASSPANLPYQLEFETWVGTSGLREPSYGIETVVTYQLSANWRSELTISHEQEKSWLVWREENLVDEFKRKETSIEPSIVGVYNEHELRFKLENVALSAKANNSFEASSDGFLTNKDDELEDFSISELALQLRYRYEFNNRSELFMVYSLGGESEIEGKKQSGKRLLNNGLKLRDEEFFFVKYKASW